MENSNHSTEVESEPLFQSDEEIIMDRIYQEDEND